MKKGKLIVLSGPSGVGKGTIREKLNFDNYDFSVSSTTRQRRENEVDGVHYNFISEEDFKKKIEDDQMLEHAEFVGNLYGTDKNEVLKLLNEGKNVLLEIESQGAIQVLNKMDDVLSIFIIPPSIEELEKRLKNRATEDDEKIKNRIKKATEEMKLQDKYQFVIVNDELENAVKKIDEILFKEVD